MILLVCFILCLKAILKVVSFVDFLGKSATTSKAGIKPPHQERHTGF
jgi:hypothetical protein